MGFATAAPHVVGVRFQKIGKLYHFDASAYPQLETGDFVIVDTSRGRQIGQIMGIIPPEKVEPDDLKPIKAPATARDLMMKKLWEAKEVAALIDCREAAAEAGGLEGVKFLKASYNYDGSLLTIIFTSEEEEVNTAKLRRKLEQKVHTRLEIRRIGARDSARLLGEFGACGGPRCCSTHLTEFSPISIKMAKAQGISLNPSEITGMCGRLRCCLIYEYEQYAEALKELPRLNKWVGTPYGEGKVIEVNPLKQTATVVVDETRHEVPQADIQPLEELRALQSKALQGCSREGHGGVCECGARVRTGKRPDEEPQAEAAGKPEAEIADEPPADAEANHQPQAAQEARESRGRRRGRRGRRPDRGGQKPS